MLLSVLCSLCALFFSLNKSEDEPNATSIIAGLGYNINSIQVPSQTKSLSLIQHNPSGKTIVVPLQYSAQSIGGKYWIFSRINDHQIEIRMINHSGEPTGVSKIQLSPNASVTHFRNQTFQINEPFLHIESGSNIMSVSISNSP